jgi:hypothetical protein
MQERLRKVRELENTRAAMVAKLPNTVSPRKANKIETDASEQKDMCEEIVHNTLTPERKSTNIPAKKLSKIKKSNSIVQLIYILRLTYIFSLFNLLYIFKTN